MPKSIYIGEIEKVLKEVVKEEEKGDKKDRGSEGQVEVCVGRGEF